MTPLLILVEDFLRKSGMSAYRFGIRAANNGRLVERLRDGKPVLNVTEQRVRDFISEWKDAA